MIFNRKILVEKKSKTLFKGTLFPNGMPDMILSVNRVDVGVGKTINLIKNRRKESYMTFEMYDVKTVSRIIKNKFQYEK